jgi:hypothetical protein
MFLRKKVRTIRRVDFWRATMQSRDRWSRNIRASASGSREAVRSFCEVKM